MKRNILFLLAALGAAALPAEEYQAKKMCWAHLVSWGFHLIEGYDRAFEENSRYQLFPGTDRILAGRYVQEDSGIPDGTRKQIESAIQWGIDGFCVDVIADPKLYSRTMSRFFRNAEGTGFKVALCIDTLNFPLDHTVQHLGEFIRTYRNHPNACLVNGKMVIFVYAMGKMTPETFGEMRKRLAAQNLDAFFLTQPMRETAMWDDAERMTAVAAVSDGFYDFGCNGFSPEQMKQRLFNGREFLKKAKRPNFLCAGIAQGYIGQFTAFYRPFLNTGSLRHSWEAALAAKADWVCLTTWNDYIENTQFEPTVNNRFNLVRLNREYLRRWRREIPPPRPPRTTLTYMEEAVAGNDITLELLNFSYTTPPGEAVVRLLEWDGKPFREYKQPLERQRLSVTTFRLTPAELGNRTGFRVQFSVAPTGGKHEFRELQPVVRRPDWLHSVRTARAGYDDLSPVPVRLTLEGETAKIRLNAWQWAGKVELLRNFWPVCEFEVDHSKKPFFERSVPLSGGSFPEDCYFVRITDSSDRVGYSNPVLRENVPMAGRTVQPVIVTGGDFDESWPAWTQGPRKLTNRMQKMTFRPMEMFQVRFDMDKEVEPSLFFSDSQWKIAAMLGKSPSGSMGIDPNYAPGFVRTEGPGGGERLVWRFDGNDNVTFASRAFPHGPMTLELWIRPESGGGTLFSVAGTALRLEPDLTLSFIRDPEWCGKAELSVKKNLPAGKWTHVAAVYTGDALELFLDGRSAGKTAASPVAFGVNAIPVIGNRLKQTDGGFRGDMAGFAVYGGVPEGGKFLLK